MRILLEPFVAGAGLSLIGSPPIAAPVVKCQHGALREAGCQVAEYRHGRFVEIAVHPSYSDSLQRNSIGVGQRLGEPSLHDGDNFNGEAGAAEACLETSSVLAPLTRLKLKARVRLADFWEPLKESKAKNLRGESLCRHATRYASTNVSPVYTPNSA